MYALLCPKTFWYVTAVMSTSRSEVKIVNESLSVGLSGFEIITINFVFWCKSIRSYSYWFIYIFHKLVNKKQSHSIISICFFQKVVKLFPNHYQMLQIYLKYIRRLIMKMGIYWLKKGGSRTYTFLNFQNTNFP